MALIHRALSFGLVPLAALLYFQIFSTTPFRGIPDIIQSHLSKMPFGSFFLESLLPPSETPLFVAATTQWSHVEKVASVAVALAELGYPITFITGRIFEEHISNLHSNIKFSPMQGPDDKVTEEEMATFLSLPPGKEQNNYLMKVVLMDHMADVHNTLQAHFEQFRKTYGNDKALVSLFDCTLTGHHPVLLGAPGIRPDAAIGINLNPLTLDSNDTFPFSMGKPPHQGPDAKEVHAKANADVAQENLRKGTYDYWWAKLRELGTVGDTYPSILQAMHLLPDYLISLGVPEFEFPRSDLRPNVRYFGAFKKVGNQGGEKEKLPSWWDDIAKAKKEGKKIVLVSQGTIEARPEELTLPTLEALKDRDDVLVIATFAVMEPEEVPGLVVPNNARVAKFVPFDVLLPLVDVLVSNGGYGAVQHCMRVGVPLVVAGEGQDKAVTNAIIDFKGVGINLGVHKPASERIGTAVDKVLTDGKFKEKAQEMSKVYEKYDVGEVFDGVVKDVVRDFQKRKRNAVQAYGAMIRGIEGVAVKVGRSLGLRLQYFQFW